MLDAMSAPLRSAPASSRLRIGRRSEPGRAYLTTFHTLGRKPVFLDWMNAAMMARLSTTPSTLRGSRLLCWVVMPDHWHGLVELGELDELSQVIRRIKGITARAIQQDHPGDRLWESGFHDHAIRNAESLRHAARYIVMNPVRAGLVERIGLYPFWDAIWLDGQHRD